MSAKKGKTIVKRSDPAEDKVIIEFEEDQEELIDLVGDEVSIPEDDFDDSLTIVSDVPGATFWSNVDNLLRAIGKDTKIQSNVFQSEYKRIIQYRMLFGVPIIILSIVSAVLAAGGLNFIPDEKSLAYTTCGISVLICIIQSGRMLIKIDERADNYQTTYKNLQRLYIEIASILKMSRHNRTSEPDAVKAGVLKRFQDIMENAMEPLSFGRELETDHILKVERKSHESA